MPTSPPSPASPRGTTPRYGTPPRSRPSALSSLRPTAVRTAAVALAAALALSMAPATALAVPSGLPAAPVPAGGPGGAPARAPLPEPTVEAPAPDVLDVDVDGTADRARGRTVTPFGAQPPIGPDAALGRDVLSFDGTNALRYDYADGFTATSSALTLECTVRFDGGLTAGDAESTGNFCGAKEAGGYSLTAYGSTLKIMVNVDGKYHGAGVTVREGVWYHVVGVWDGQEVALYLDGKKVAEKDAPGTAITPPKEAARQFFLGADTNGSGNPQFHGTTSVAGAGIFGRALSAEEITARYVQAFSDRSDADVTAQVTSPAGGSHLTGPTTFAATVEHEELLAAPLEFTLDQKPVVLGDEIGPGLAAGEHTIEYRGTDAFGQEVSGSSTFSSAAIPVADGASQEAADGSARLTARATHPSGGHLDTTFLEGDVAPARGTSQGTIDPAAFGEDGSLPADTELTDPQGTDDALRPADDAQLEAPVSARTPALRTDLDFTGDGQQILWRGQADPSRAVGLLLLDTTTGRYEVVDTSRGAADRTIELSAPASDRHDDGGTVRALVVGVDPFADDLDAPVRDGFEDPDSFDFSLMHITDPQYLSEGATQRPSAEERKVWASAYTDSYDWVAEHGAEHKVAYVAHTGDVIENWNTNDEDRDVAIEEFEFASGAQKVLEDTGVVHSVLPGNHDNRGGGDVGEDSLFNDYFGPERYEALEEKETWKQAGVEYHPWKPGDNQNSYTLFTAADRDVIAISLGYDVTEEEVAWAGEVLDQYPGRNAILLTHAYNKPSDSADGRGAGFSHDGLLIRDEVLAKHPKVALVLSGHEHGVSISVRKDVGQRGNNVVELLADYQFYEVGSDQLDLTEVGGYGQDTGLRFGAAFFRLLQFDLDAGEMSVDTDSPHLDEFGATEYDDKQRYDGHEDDFRLPVQFEGRTTTFRTDAVIGLTPSDRVIGETTHASGEPATVTWDGLEDGRAYGWFAVSRDAGTGEAVDAPQLRSRALRATPAELDGGIVQFSAFTATGAEIDDTPGEPGPDDDGSGDGNGGGDGPGSDNGSGSGSGSGDAGAGTGDGSTAGSGTAASPGAAPADHGTERTPGPATAGAGRTGALPRTGAEVLPWALAAAGLIAAGSVLVRLRRR